MARLAVLAATVALAALPGAVLAAPPEGDAAAGRAVAEQWCARCHDIAPGGAFRQEPPAFAAIAVYRTPERIWAQIMAPQVHTAMPDLASVLGLSAADLTAYITSLEPPPLP